MTESMRGLMLGRSPHGERGLKSLLRWMKRKIPRSLSSWRAWIEISSKEITADCYHGRSPHGERGLKSNSTRIAVIHVGRSPHGERGLKYERPAQLHTARWSRSPHGERGLKSAGT